MQKISESLLDGGTVVTTLAITPCDIIAGESFETDMCGLGWKFLCRRISQTSGSNFRSRAAYPVIELWLDHGRLQGSSLGTLLVSIVRKTLDPNQVLENATGTVNFVGGQHGASTKIFTTTNWIDKRLNHVVVTVPLPFLCGKAPSPARPALKAPLEMERVLAEHLVGRGFTDTRFLLFTKRSATGKVYAPSALYAHSYIVCKHSEYVKDLIHSGFSESQAEDLDTTPTEDQLYRDDYDYESDSDLDGDEMYLESALDATEVTTAEVAEPAESGSVEFTTLKTSPVQVQADGTNSAATAPVEPTLEPLVSLLTPSSNFQRIGRTVFVPATAHRTWSALLVYLYTGKVVFAPLRSSLETHSKLTLPTSTFPPPCSPKSMYRLADMAQLEDLKALSLDAITEGITAQNVVGELFCRFTSRYPNTVQTVQVGLMCQFYRKEGVAGRFEEELERIVKEGREYAIKALFLVYEQLGCARDCLSLK